MAGLPAPNGAGGMKWFHLVCGTSGVEMREPMACGTFIRERSPGCKARIPCTFDSIFHVLLIFFFLFHLLKLPSAAVIKERLSSTSLLHDNCNCFPVVSCLRTLIPLQLSFYRACLAGEQSAVALPGLGGPLLATPGPCACHTPLCSPAPGPGPAPCMAAAHGTHAK